MGDGLMHKASKGREIEPSFFAVLLYELGFFGLGQRKTELIPADTLWLDLKLSGALEVSGCDPKLPFIQVSVADLAGLVVVNDGYSSFVASC